MCQSSSVALCIALQSYIVTQYYPASSDVRETKLLTRAKRAVLCILIPVSAVIIIIVITLISVPYLDNVAACNVVLQYMFNRDCISVSDL